MAYSPKSLIAGLLTVPSVQPRTSIQPLTGKAASRQVIVEAWAQGFNVGAIVLLILLVLCNYRPHVLLHKLIIVELFLALGHGFFIFFSDPAYGWILSSTATALYVSYTIHNVVAWLKIKPFLPTWGVRSFIISLVIVQPFWIVEAWANFEYFNGLGKETFKETRYFEPLARDPWWVFTSIKLVLVINKNYELTLSGLVRTSPRFGVMLLCLLLSIVFLVIDVISTALISHQSGINPFWRLALVFKCASDVIFLDDFKSVLDHIAQSAMKEFGTFRYSSNQGLPSHNGHSGAISKQPDGHLRMSTISSVQKRMPWKRTINSKAGWSQGYNNSGRSVNRREYESMARDIEYMATREADRRTSISTPRQTTSHSSFDRYGSGDHAAAIHSLEEGEPSCAEYEFAPQSALHHEMESAQNYDDIPMVPLKARTRDDIFSWEWKPRSS